MIPPQEFLKQHEAGGSCKLHKPRMTWNTRKIDKTSS